MITFLTRGFIYPLYELFTGRRVLSRWREYERTQWLSQPEIKALQIQRLHNLLVHAYRHVPFYRQRLSSIGYQLEEPPELELFRQLPLLSKDDILSHRDEMVASNFSPSMLKLDATGGSTGHTLSFYHDRNSLDHISAITIRGDRWAGLDIGTPNARLWGAPNELKAQGRFVNRLTNRALNRLFLDCFHLSDELLADYVEKLRRYRPKVLVGYATALATMAEFIEAHNIQDLRLQSIISSAETLFDEQRQQIESAFGCKVYNRYGCREAGPLIVECEEGRMHVSADYVHLELLRNGQPVPPGEVGEIVITPLFNYGMPLIRYQIGDMGIAASQVPCACGRGLPLIERVLGRTSDMLVNTRGEFFHGEYFSHLFYHQPGVRQFQVVQPDPQHLIFRTVTDQNFDTNLFEKLEETILDFVGPMEIEWRIVDEIPPLKSGKRSFTVSMVPVDFATSNVGTD